MEQFKKDTIGKLKVLIAKSAEKQNKILFNGFHTDLIKRYYNAVDVQWDYTNKRVSMNVIADDDHYKPNTINVNMELMPLVISYQDLRGYLESCILEDNKSVLHYLKLLFQYKEKISGGKRSSVEDPIYMNTLLS